MKLFRHAASKFALAIIIVFSLLGIIFFLCGSIGTNSNSFTRTVSHAFTQRFSITFTGRISNTLIQRIGNTFSNPDTNSIADAISKIYSGPCSRAERNSLRTGKSAT
jgi:hypothetical protein